MDTQIFTSSRGFFPPCWCLFISPPLQRGLFIVSLHLSSSLFSSKKKTIKKEPEPSAESLLFPWIMYQDYCGNYDTSSRGSSSTSPAQPESFTSGSSTIGSPISTSGYQVTPAKHRHCHLCDVSLFFWGGLNIKCLLFKRPREKRNDENIRVTFRGFC